MKIAHVTATFPPYWAGTGNVAYHNARVVHERGHEVTVFTARPVGREPMSFPFQVEYLPSIFSIGNAPVTPKLIGKLEGFDVVHLHYPYIFGSELVALSLKRRQQPLVVTYHNDLLSPGWKGIAFSAYSKLNQRWILAQAKQLVATSEDYAHHSLLRRAHRGHRDLQVLAVPNGVDLEQFKPSSDPNPALYEKYHLHLGMPIVLFVGAMDKPHFFKGVPTLLAALKRIPDVQAIFVGDGDLRQTFQQAISPEDMKRFHFVGGVPLADLISFYQTADVTVLPSLTMGEAFGMVLIESLACGTPVVASNLPGVRTVVSEGIDGFLATPGDAENLAAQIRKVLFSCHASEMGMNGRLKVEQKYGWDVIGDQLERLYEDVIRR